MATFTKTITNSIQCFGGGPSVKWGDSNYPYTMVWGVSTWGDGESLPIRIYKLISNSQSMSFDYAGCTLTRPLDIGSVEASFSGQSFTMQNGDWYYVFTSDTTNGSERDFASWTSQSANDFTFTCQSAGSTSWSEL